MVKAITYILENNATVQGLVGNRVGGVTTDYKVFPVVVPESEVAPYIAVRLVGRTLQGKGCDYTYSVQTVCYHTTYDGVTTLNDAIISAIEGQAAATVNGVTFSFANFTNESDEYVKEHSLYAKISTFDCSGQ